LTRARRARTLARVTLTELLVVVALVALVLAGGFAILDQGQQAWAFGAARVEAQQSARVALDRLAADVRGAGRGGVAPVAVAEPQRLVLQQDLDGDGKIGPTRERITWRLAGRVLRRDAGGGAQPVINGVREFALVYYDGAGAPTTSPPAVRAVGIWLTTRADHARSLAGRDAGATVATLVRIRNR
jgi:type II secretory pathway component PulJ